MRILCFHPALAPYRVDAFNMLADEFDFELVLLGRNLQEQKFDQSTILQRTRCRISYLLAGFNIRERYIRIGVAHKIISTHPDIVITGEFSLTTIVAALLRLVTFGAYRHFVQTDDNPYLFMHMGIVRRILRWIFVRTASGFIVSSKDMRSKYRALVPSWKKLRIGVLPIIYDEGDFRRNASVVFEMADKWRRENIFTGEVAIFFFGRLVEVKNIKWLIECAADKRWPNNAKLFLVGSGQQENELKSLLEFNRVKHRIMFLGRKEGLELSSLMAAQDIMVLPSRSETYGAVVSESLLWGAQCLVSDMVGAKVLIDETNGKVFPLDCKEDFFTAIAEMVAHTPQWNVGRSSRLRISLKDAMDDLKEVLR